jgi:hypothetical protein
MNDNIEQLKQIIENTHQCMAQFVESIAVSETFKGQIVWQGIVHIFDIKDNALTTRCYAWSSPVEGSKTRRFYAVLHIPPVDSPQKAVRASIVHDFKQGS